MRREMLSDSEDSLSDSDHEERKVEEEELCFFHFNPKHLKLRNRVFQTIYFSTVPKKICVIQLYAL